MPTEDTTNFSNHHAHLRDHLRHVKETGRPMFIMNQNGEKEAVVMDARTFDRLMEKVELAGHLDMLDRGMKEARAGQSNEFRGAIRGIADELGLKLNR